MKNFWKVYFTYFFGLLLFTVSVIPVVMWLSGEWPGWVMHFYLFTIPADIAFIDTFF